MKEIEDQAGLLALAMQSPEFQEAFGPLPTEEELFADLSKNMYFIPAGSTETTNKPRKAPHLRFIPADNGKYSV